MYVTGVYYEETVVHYCVGEGVKHGNFALSTKLIR